MLLAIKLEIERYIVPYVSDTDKLQIICSSYVLMIFLCVFN